MAAYTEHYGLHQWAATDNFLRTDFNADHLLIDTALNGLETGKAEMAFGTYIGDGSLMEYVTDVPYQEIELGFQPKAVLVIMPSFQMGGISWNAWNTVTLVQGVLTQATNGNYHTKAQITDNGFQVNNCMNVGSINYCYVALK